MFATGGSERVTGPLVSSNEKVKSTRSIPTLTNSVKRTNHYLVVDLGVFSFPTTLVSRIRSSGVTLEDEGSGTFSLKPRLYMSRHVSLFQPSEAPPSGTEFDG